MEKPHYVSKFETWPLGSSSEGHPAASSLSSSASTTGGLYAEYATSAESYSSSDASTSATADVSASEHQYSQPSSSSTQPSQSPRESAIIESNRIALPRELTTRVERFKWNSVFQEYYDMIFKDAGEHFSVVTSALGRISALYQDFLRTAVMYTKIIVSERFLENHQKSIKPSDVGGIAGGDKYIVEGIFFKFAVDTRQIYGGVDNAGKSFGHELRALSLLQNLALDLIHVPLFVVIDYRGFRVAAQSLVPVGLAVHRDTLKFGSADAGHVIRNTDPTLRAKFDEAGKMLNLIEHTVGLSEKETLRTRMPIDIEGHLGTDRRYYVLDAARLMPPEVPSGQGTHLYRLLRSEFVRQYREPLCSDSFAHFIAVDPQKREYSRAIKEATLYLRAVSLPRFVQWLLQHEDTGSRISLTQEMHDRGLNMRSLGILYTLMSNTNSSYWRSRILTEMVLRIAKVTVRVLMRTAMEKIRLATHEPYVRVVVQYFNLLFGNASESSEYWMNELSRSIRLSFYYHLDSPIAKENHNNSATDHENKQTAAAEKSFDSSATFPPELTRLTNEQVDIALLFRDLVPKCGLKLVNQTLLSSISRQTLQQEQPFSENDFGETVPVQKNMDIVEYSATYATYQKYFQFGPRSELVEPILRKISANNLPGPFYVPYLAARACFALWQQLRHASASSASPSLGSSSPPPVPLQSAASLWNSGSSLLASSDSSPSLTDSRRQFKERLYSTQSSWTSQQTLENISLSLSYINLPKLTTERFLSIFHDEVLLQQCKTRKPTVYKLLGKWAAACSGGGCDDFLGAIFCCQVFVLRKLNIHTLADQALTQLHELHPKIPSNSRLYRYYLSKLEMIGLAPEKMIQGAEPQLQTKLAHPSPRHHSHQSNT